MKITTKQYKKIKNDGELEKSKKKLRVYFNKYICLRDLQVDANGNVFGICISSGRRWDAVLFSDRSIMNGREWHASHYWNEDKYGSVRYDERNVNGQLGNLNKYHSGDKTNYEVGLRKKIGDDGFESLKRAKNKVKVWNILEIDRMIFEYKDKAKIEAGRLGVKIT